MNQATTQQYAPTGSLDRSVAMRLRSVAAKLRAYTLVIGVAHVVVCLIVAVIIQCGIDYGTHGVRWSIRAAMLGAIVGGVIVLVRRRIVRPLRKRFGIAEMANLVERRYPDLSSSLISAVRFSSGDVGSASDNSRTLMAGVVDRAGREAREFDFNVVLDKHRARRAGIMLTLAILISSSIAIADPHLVGLWFARNVLLQNVDWPQRTHLVVDMTGNELIGARGDDLVIEATALGVQPRVVEIIYETVSGKVGRETMVTVGSSSAYRYRYTIKNAQEDLDFQLKGGDDLTDSIHVRLLERPRVAKTSMNIVPPPYTRQEPVHLGDGQRVAQVLPGSEVTIRIETNKPVTQSTLMAGRDVVTAAQRDGNGYQATFAPDETHTYHFALLDEVGLENRRPARFSIRVVADEPPRLRLTLPGVGGMITPQAMLEMELEFTDTYGLATTEAVYRTSRENADDGSIPLPTFTPGTTSFSTSVIWPVAEEALDPGETLTLFSRASDFDNINGPNEAQSPEVMLRVVSREELLAELARREQEYRGDFERLVDSQERLRGDLLTLLGRHQSSTTETLSDDLSPLERRQRNIAGSVNVIRQQFEQILAELHVNQLDTLDERDRLGKRIIEPITQLAKRDLVAAADAVRQWSRAPESETANQIDPQQVKILVEMRSVLTSMIQWEGYQEVVNMLRDIIRLQQELHSETKAALEKQAGEVFED